jgi:hypothetical protein
VSKDRDIGMPAILSPQVAVGGASHVNVSDELSGEEWARQEVLRLRGRGENTNRSTAAALEFLRIHAGSGSVFLQQARVAANQGGSSRSGASAVADALEGWLAYDAAGLAPGVSIERLAQIKVATDLMEQVDRLLNDGQAHVAAPIVLAGAALEEFLISLAIANEIVLVPDPSLSTCTEALKKAEVITNEDIKDITAWVGQRTDAAHGNFEALSLNRARVMADGINLFMRQHATS